MSTQTPDAAAGGPISITYQIGADTISSITKEIELLVVACDPRNLIPICDYEKPERDFFGKLVNFTFHTSLLLVKGGPQSQYAVIFSPETLDGMGGHVYAFRNETVKTFGFAAANAMAENLVTVYQVSADTLPVKTFETYLKQDLQTIKWWPYGQDYEITDTVTTPYFDHFTIDDLAKGKDHTLPWQFLDLQGKCKTIYAHASACFESTLQCWQYANMLLDPNNKFGVKLPERRDAPIVILGAGASGVLFANRLRDLHYTNVEILEVTDRSDGKIHTIVKDDPHPPGHNESTYCELGCCYLSPAYDDFVTYLTPFLTGNRRIPLATGADADRFRGIVTTGQFNGWEPPAPSLMNFDQYVLQKTKYELGYAADYSDWKIKAEMFLSLETYNLLYPNFMGDTVPMPPQQPSDFANFGLKTFHQYLAVNGLLALVGPLQYGYCVQGYGPLNDISAYYGLIWIPPTVINGMICGSLCGTPVVTAWSKGWGDVWEQMKAGMKITYNVTTTNITRPPA